MKKGVTAEINKVFRSRDPLICPFFLRTFSSRVNPMPAHLHLSWFQTCGPAIIQTMTARQDVDCVRRFPINSRSRLFWWNLRQRLSFPPM